MALVVGYQWFATIVGLGVGDGIYLWALFGHLHSMGGIETASFGILDERTAATASCSLGICE